MASHSTRQLQRNIVNLVANPLQVGEASIGLTRTRHIRQVLLESLRTPELKDRITPHVNFFQRIVKEKLKCKRERSGRSEMEIELGMSVDVCMCVCVCVYVYVRVVWVVCVCE